MIGGFNYPFHADAKMQKTVGASMAPAVEGDMASHNIMTSVNAGPGGLVAGPNGVAIARFVWLEYSQLDPNNAPIIAVNYATPTFSAPAGFVHREQQGTMVNWLGGASMWIPPGIMVTAHQQGDFFVINRGQEYAQIGMSAYADLVTGDVWFGNAGASPYDSAFTGNVTGRTFSGTGHIVGNVLEVESVVSTGVPLVPGAKVTMAGLPPGLVSVTTQVSGTPGEVGSYTLNYADLAIPVGTPFTADYGELNVTALTSGVVSMGAVLQPVPAPPATPSKVTGFGTGTGGMGTYYVDNPAGGAFTGGTSAVETKWRATSAGGPGALLKMSSWG